MQIGNAYALLSQTATAERWLSQALTGYEAWLATLVNEPNRPRIVADDRSIVQQRIRDIEVALENLGV